MLLAKFTRSIYYNIIQNEELKVRAVDMTAVTQTKLSIYSLLAKEVTLHELVFEEHN